MSSSNSALAIMDNAEDNNKGTKYTPTKEKIYSIHEDIAKLISEEQLAGTSGASILNAITESKARVSNILKEPNKRRYFSSNIESSETFLRSHTNSKTNLVILFADLVGSTHMSNILELSDLITILQIFIQEMTIMAIKNHGYILKYSGDAVIVYFPVIDNNFSLASKNAISCAMNMLLIVDQGINPVLEEFGFAKLRLKIGIDSGENAIIEYAISMKNSHVDIIGYPMNIAAKITSLAKPNHISIGIITYQRLDSKVEHSLKKLGLENVEYIDYQTGDAYSILSLPLDKYI